MSHRSANRRRAASGAYESGLRRKEGGSKPVYYIDKFTVTDLEGRPLELDKLFAGGSGLISGTQFPFCGKVDNQTEQSAQDKDEDAQEEVYEVLAISTLIESYDIGTDRLFWVESDDSWLILLSPANEQEPLHVNFLLAHRLIQVVVGAALMDPALTFQDLPMVILHSRDWHIIPPLDTAEDSLSLAAEFIPYYLVPYLTTLDPVARDLLMDCPLITHYVDLYKEKDVSDDGQPHIAPNDLHTPHQLLSLQACTPHVLQAVSKAFPQELWHQCKAGRLEGAPTNHGNDYLAGDYVLMKPDQPRISSDSWNLYARFRFGKIVSHDGISCHIQWFHHSSTVPVGELGHTQELFGTLQCDSKPLSLVQEKVSLIYVQPGQVPPTLSNPEYFCRFMWDDSQGCFFDFSPQPDHFYFNGKAFKCIACEAKAHKKYLKEAYHLPSNHLFMAEELDDAIPELIEQGYKIRVLDVFSGAGGFACGFQQTGILSVEAAIEKSEVAAETFRLNHPLAKVYCDDTEALLLDFLEKKGAPSPSHTGISWDLEPGYSVLCAGFPCQPFSFANRNKKVLDPRSILIANALSWVEALRPTYVVLENVLGMIHHEFPEGGKHIIIKFLTCALINLGYQLRMGIIQSAAFGVPQTRERFIVIAARSGHTLPNFPAPTHQTNRNRNSRVTSLTLETLRSATSKEDALHAPNPSVALKSTLEDYLGPPADGDWPDLARTIRTGPQKHPVEDRCWDVMEEMIIQGFPKEYKMATASITEQRRMIGNALPPPLAKAIGLEIIRAHLVDLRRQAEGHTCPIFMENVERQQRHQASGA